MSPKERTKLIARLQLRHPESEQRRNPEDCGKYSIEFFDRGTHELVGHYDIDESDSRTYHIRRNPYLVLSKPKNLTGLPQDHRIWKGDL